MSFEHLDANSDGVISLEEFIAKAPSGRRNPEDIFKRLDLNGDGYVSQPEWDAMPKRRKGRS
jgi:Ca2+-binding EF-hand superfamily protein